jgi:hypothetical protein
MTPLCGFSELAGVVDELLSELIRTLVEGGKLRLDDRATCVLRYYVATTPWPRKAWDYRPTTQAYVMPPTGHAIIKAPIPTQYQ